jgi:hemoglobin
VTEGSLYAALGGAPVVRALVDRFYDDMDADPAFAALRALHPPELASSRVKLHDFLTGWLGGPPLYVEKHGHPRLRARHLPFAIDDAQVAAWLACMERALDAVVGDDALRARLLAGLAPLAHHMRNRP